MPLGLPAHSHITQDCQYAEKIDMSSHNLFLQRQLTNWLSRKTPTGGVRRVAALAASVASDIGNVRSENQDRAILAHGWDREGHDFIVAVVADGIGGMRNGGACASIAVGSFLAALHEQAHSASTNPENWLREAVNVSNRSVYGHFHGDGGSTMVAVVLRPNRDAFWMSVGDSRVYEVFNRELHQASIDDTIAGQLGKNANVAAEQSKLLQFIGMGDDLEVHVSQINTECVQTIILTTDGIHYVAPTPKLLEAIFINATDLGVCAKRFLDLAKWCGGPDNATVAILSLNEVLDLNPKMPYDFIEVWDAFGEIQIHLNDASMSESNFAPKQEVLPRQQYSRPRITRIKRAAVSDTVPDSSASTNAEYAHEKNNNERQKNKPVPTKKTSAKPKVSKKIPQLLIDFPNKIN